MNKRLKTFLQGLAALVLAVLAFYAGSLWAAIRDFEAREKVVEGFDENLAAAAENEAKSVQELAAKAGLPPLPPGDYQLRILGRHGERLVKITVKLEAGSLRLSLPDSPSVKPVKISDDGTFFDWWSEGYGGDRFIGLRTEDGVFGRIYFSHGFDVGMEHFWIEPPDHRPPPAPPHIRRPRPRLKS